MENKIFKIDIFIVFIGAILAISSYIFYEKNIVLTIAIFILSILIDIKYIRRKRNKKIEKRINNSYGS